MIESLHRFGMVYILENVEAKRVKVGFTTRSVENRRIDVNQMHLGTRATCQVCGTRLHVKRILQQRLIPKHVLSGWPCRGSNSLPLEKDTSLAKEYLEELKASHEKLIGNEKGSNTRRINTLEERIKKFENFKKPLGVWKINTIYSTNNAEDVEKKSHKLLSTFIDADSQFGEVFCCSIEEARMAVETVIAELGLVDSTEKEII